MARLVVRLSESRPGMGGGGQSGIESCRRRRRVIGSLNKRAMTSRSAFVSRVHLGMTSLLVLVLGSLAEPALAESWRIDFAKTNGVLRPLHGVNGGPWCYRGTVDLREDHRRLAIPFTRLHDTVWVNAEAVDVHTIFRDSRDDPADPANYDFRATDDVVDAVLETGARVVFRLGESIEHTPRKYWVHPPANPAHWAEVAVGIVRHYEEGWAGGRQRDVAYWEIWNEPDVRPGMWTGSDAEFFRLFELTAKAIKARFPGVRVGGPGVGGVGSASGGGLEPSPFTRAFLAYCREHAVPLDFFSWHRYTADAPSMVRYAVAVRRWLDEAGFRGTESHLNEWNHLPGEDWSPMAREGQGPARDRWYERMNGIEGAAFAASVLLRLQDAPVDVANYFSGEVQGFGLFGFQGTPKKTFHAFHLFRELLGAPRRVRVVRDGAVAAGKELVLAAGLDATGGSGAVLAVHEGPEAKRLDLGLAGFPGKGTLQARVVLLDAARDRWREVAGVPEDTGVGRLSVSLPGPAVVLIELERR